MNELCLNSIGGECISVLHMTTFIVCLVILGFIFGFVLKGLLIQRRTINGIKEV